MYAYGGNLSMGPHRFSLKGGPTAAAAKCPKEEVRPWAPPSCGRWGGEFSAYSRMYSVVGKSEVDMNDAVTLSM